MPDIPAANAWIAEQRPGVLGAGLMLYTVDIAPDDEAFFDAWYTHEHLPERVSTPGFLRGRRYLRSDGSPGQRHLTLYETVDATVFSSAEYLRRLDSPTQLTRQAVGRFIHPQRAVLRVIFSHGATIGREMSVVHLAPERSDNLRDWVEQRAKQALSGPTVCGLHLAEVDLDATKAKSATLEGQGAGEAEARPECVLFVDALAGAADVARQLAATAPANVTAEITTYNHLALLDHASLEPRREHPRSTERTS